MKFNEEIFKKALSECKIIRWENHFKNVVKSYLKLEIEKNQLSIYGVTKSFTAGDIVNELKDCETLDDAIRYFDDMRN